MTRLAHARLAPTDGTAPAVSRARGAAGAGANTAARADSGPHNLLRARAQLHARANTIMLFKRRDAATAASPDAPAPDAVAWHALDGDAVLRELGSSLEDGLSVAEAEDRLEKCAWLLRAIASGERMAAARVGGFFFVRTGAPGVWLWAGAVRRTPSIALTVAVSHTIALRVTWLSALRAAAAAAAAACRRRARPSPLPPSRRPSPFQQNTHTHTTKGTAATRSRRRASPAFSPSCGGS